MPEGPHRGSHMGGVCLLLRLGTPLLVVFEGKPRGNNVPFRGSILKKETHPHKDSMSMGVALVEIYLKGLCNYGDGRYWK